MLQQLPEQIAAGDLRNEQWNTLCTLTDTLQPAELSALRQKVLALLFPFGTWTIGLIVFYVAGHRYTPSIGVAWQNPSSLIELSGFVVILVGNAIIVLLKSNPRSRLSRCCAKIDRCDVRDGSR